MKKNLKNLVMCLLFIPTFVGAITTVNIKCDKDSLKALEETNCKVTLDTTDKISCLDFSLEKNEQLTYSKFEINLDQWQGNPLEGRFTLYTDKEYTGIIEVGTFTIAAPKGIAKNVTESIGLDSNAALSVYMSDNETLSEVKVNEAKINLEKSGDISNINDNENGNIKNIIIGVIVLAFVATGIIYFVKQKKN